jgi:hypothetical protein
MGKPGAFRVSLPMEAGGTAGGIDEEMTRREPVFFFGIEKS